MAGLKRKWCSHLPAEVLVLQGDETLILKSPLQQTHAFAGCDIAKKERKKKTQNVPPSPTHSPFV